jgi:hypothetical protein
LSQDTAVLKQVLGASFNKHFELKRMEMADDGTNDRWASTDELWHLAGAFRNKGWQLSKVVKENNIRWDFEQLAWYFESIFVSEAKHGL